MEKIENCLYIVATPIGNLEELSPRAQYILSNVDLIACEDTRVTKKLFSLLGLKQDKDFISYQNYNEEQKSQDIIDIIIKGDYKKDKIKNNIFHYKNDGNVNIYMVASEIKNFLDSHITITPISYKQFNFKAKRPEITSLLTTEYQFNFNKSIRYWKESLRSCLKHYLNLEK